MAKEEEIIKIAQFQHSGSTTTIQVEETTKLRRITLVRTRFIMGQVKNVGELHIYTGEEEEYLEAIRKAAEIMQVIAFEGFEKAKSLGTPESALG